MLKQDAEDFVDKYGKSVYRFALSLTKNKDIADDVFQEVFLRYIRKNPYFESDEHAKAWLFVVTRNCSRNYFMSAFVRKCVPLVEDFPILKEQSYGIYEKVLKLPKKYRIVIHLFYYEEYTTKEIAQILNKKETTIRTQLKRARALLKQQIEGSDIDEVL